MDDAMNTQAPETTRNPARIRTSGSKVHAAVVGGRGRVVHVRCRQNRPFRGRTTRLALATEITCERCKALGA